MTNATNRRIVLASRPPHGAPTQENFRLEEVTKPTPKEGEMLLRTVYLSLDPYMRGRMSDAESYADPVAIDDVMVGGTVCQVEASNHPDYEAGEWFLPTLLAGKTTLSQLVRWSLNLVKNRKILLTR